MDIQFIDYAQAVVRHFEYYEPFDSPRREAYCRLVRDTFHKRGLCTEPASSCAADKCLLDARDEPRLRVYHPVDEIARSRTAAYCFLNDNRAGLRIPINQDLVVDVVEARKYGRQAHRLPRQIVVQYVWREEVPLAGQDFGPLRDQGAELLCGGTLVFDERGNLLSWMRKPGTQVQEDALKGAARLEQLRQHVARQVAHGAVGLHGDGPFEALGVWTPPVVAALSEGAWRLEIRPALRDVLDREPQPGAEGEQAAEGRERGRPSWQSQRCAVEPWQVPRGGQNPGCLDLLGAGGGTASHGHCCLDRAGAHEKLPADPGPEPDGRTGQARPPGAPLPGK